MSNYYAINDIVVTADGKVCGLVFNANGDIPVSEDTINSFIGKDSALADIVLTGGASTSSKTLKAIVEAGMNILISNNLITAGVKSEAQVLAEYIPTAHPGICSNGTVKGEEVAANGNIVSGYKGENGAGFAYIMSKAEKSYLAVTNNMLGCKIYAANIDKATGEATVIDVTTPSPVILRPGGVTFEDIYELFPDVSYDKHLTLDVITDTVQPKSPGMKYKHYAPKTEFLASIRFALVCAKITLPSISSGSGLGARAEASNSSAVSSRGAAPSSSSF